MQSISDHAYAHDFEHLCHSDWFTKSVQDLLWKYVSRYWNYHGPVPIEWREDVCQEVRVQVWQNSEKYKQQEGEKEAWVYGIIRNVVRNWLRKSSNRREIPTDPEEFRQSPQEFQRAESPEQHAELNELKDMTDELIKNLPPRYRDVLELVRQGHTPLEIAKILQMNPATARQRVKRGRDMLKDRLRTLGLHNR